MKKIIITLVSIIVVISGIVIAININKSNKTNYQESEITEIAEENILDDCTDEYEASQEKIQETNANEEKVSPNASITLKTYYTDCGHTKSEYKTVTEELVNKTKNEVEEKYKDYEVLKFTDSDIILEKEENGECGEHYIVRDKNGKVAIYELESNDKEIEYEVTDISTEYLTATDRNNIEKGIRVNRKTRFKSINRGF